MTMTLLITQVTIHEQDPHWGKARELTHGAEEQSKISAAKVG